MRPGDVGRIRRMLCVRVPRWQREDARHQMFAIGTYGKRDLLLWLPEGIGGDLGHGTVDVQASHRAVAVDVEHRAPGNPRFPLHNGSGVADERQASRFESLLGLRNAVAAGDRHRIVRVVRVGPAAEGAAGAPGLEHHQQS